MSPSRFTCRGNDTALKGLRKGSYRVLGAVFKGSEVPLRFLSGRFIRQIKNSHDHVGRYPDYWGLLGNIRGPTRVPNESLTKPTVKDH